MESAICRCGDDTESGARHKGRTRSVDTRATIETGRPEYVAHRSEHQAFQIWKLTMLVELRIDLQLAKSHQTVWSLEHV